MTRMREQYIDIDLIASWEKIVQGGGFERCMPDLMRAAKASAEARAEEVGGTVRVENMPQVIVKEGSHPLLGNVFMIGTRWLCDVPEGALTTAER